MKNLIKIRWFELIYVAIAIATFKHTSWGFSTVLEGPEPIIDWANFVFSFVGIWQLGGLLIWFLWGGLMAIAVDVGMFFVSKAIREYFINNDEGQPWGLWGTYLIIAIVSGYTQMLYAVQHAAEMKIVPNTLAMLQTGGWLYTLFEYRLVLLPLSLPFISFMYTVSLKVQEFLQKPHMGKKNNIGETVYNVIEAAKYVGKSSSLIRMRSIEGIFGNKDRNGKWFYTKKELDDFKSQNT